MSQHPPAAIPAETEGELADHIDAERIRFVLIQSTLPIIFSPVASLILVITLWHAVAPLRLLVFAGGLWLLAAQRVLATRAFPDPVPRGKALRHFEWSYIGSIVLVDLWWGIGALFLLAPGATTENAIVFSFLMLMAGGHTASYSAHGPLVVLGVLALTVPITVLFAAQPDTFHWPLAFVALMFVAASFRSVRTLGYFFGRTYRLAHDLQRERDRAELLARIDMLSGLHNRRAFYERGQEELGLHQERGTPLSLLMIDIDHFKSINDRYGHAGGDQAIRNLAELVRTELRPAEIAGRLGGEEFAVLMPGTPVVVAADCAQRLVRRAAELAIAFEQHTIRFTISIGVAGCRAEDGFDSFVARADQALYRAKHEGRNRYVLADAATTVAVP